MYRQVAKLIFGFLIFTAFLSCSRLKNYFKKKEETKLKVFHVFVPLQEDYPLLTQGILQILKGNFQKAEIEVQEGLSDTYVIAPFDEWITKTDPEAFLKLQIKAPRAEERIHMAAFLKKVEARLPFKIKVPSFEGEGSEIRGEYLFCRTQLPEGDLLEKQLCKTFILSVCGNEQKFFSKKITHSPVPSCQLSLESSKESVDPAKAQDSKILPLMGFALPLKVGNDYPFLKAGEFDDAFLMSLF